jgi:hypothetical protein
MQYIVRHEHIYKNLTGKLLIRSDRLPPDQEGMRRLLSNSSIILCTLSMLSNPVLTQNGTFAVVPPKRLVIDEASQINVFDFMVCFSTLPFRSNDIFPVPISIYS